MPAALHFITGVGPGPHGSWFGYMDGFGAHFREHKIEMIVFHCWEPGCSTYLENVDLETVNSYLKSLFYHLVLLIEADSFNQPLFALCVF